MFEREFTQARVFRSSLGLKRVIFSYWNNSQYNRLVLLLPESVQLEGSKSRRLLELFYPARTCRAETLPYVPTKHFILEGYAF